MAEHSTIEWTDSTWNPITGCSVVSPGCTNCYAMGLAGTRLRHHPSRAGLTRDSKAGPVWNGEVRLNEEWLTQPLQWKRPRMIFVCAHGDLFHESVPDAWIDSVFAVMALSPQHTFQVLTKRSARMRAYLSSDETAGRLTRALAHGIDGIGTLEVRNRSDGLPGFMLPNVWLGVSAEDQRRADERVPDLLATPAAVRFVSAEPLLGPIDFHQYLLGFPAGHPADCACGHGHGFTRCPNYGRVVQRCHRCSCTEFRKAAGSDGLHWIIVGGESGPGARPMHPAWARSIRDQCAAAGVAFHFKQHGAWAAIDQSAGADEAGWKGRGDWMILSADGDLDIPDDRWPDEAAGEVAVVRVGKKVAGRLLDGVTHDGMPEARI